MKKDNNTAVLLQAFANTDISVFMYYPQEKRIKVPEKVCEKYHCREEYENMPETLRDEFVLPEDYPVFMDSYRKIEEGEKSSTAMFHSKDLSLCWRVTLTVLNWKKGQPAEEVLGVIEDVTEWDKDKQLIQQIQSQLTQKNSEDDLQEARRLISSAISGQYYALYHIWLETRRYICYQEQLPGILAKIGEKGDYETAWESYISHYIAPEDQEAMRKFADIHTLADRLRDKKSITHVYRRKNVGWTRGQFIAAKRDASGRVTNVIFSVVDINNEKNMEIAQRKAVYEAEHDPLTGVLNRKGFEKIIAASEIKTLPIGLAIIDVDNFKMINDHHGHECGDKILKTTAQILVSVFRSEDSVFRLGGDEFGVLLKNCEVSAWETLCGKQQKVHAVLAEEFPEISATLSVGICFSKEGFVDRMYKFADEALYETKQTGRAGCTVISMDSGEKNSWHDTSISLQTQNLLMLSDTGMFRFECDRKDLKTARLVCGEVSKSIFDFPMDATPERCFQLWYDRLDKFYLDTIVRAVKKAVQGHVMECTYRWNHPKYGWVYMRTGGRGEEDGEHQVLYGYHHAMRDTEIIESDDEKKILEAISGIYFCSYYVDLNQNTFMILKGAGGEQKLNMKLDRAKETLTQAIYTLAHPNDRKKMLTFADFETLPDRLEKEDHIDCEYMSLSEKKWCRASFFPVKRDEAGRVNKVLYVVASLDAEKAKEADTGILNKKSVESLYNNVPGGIVMYEWDGKELRTIHISAYYEKEYGYTLNAEEGDKRGPDYKRVHPDDLGGYQKAIAHALAVTHELHYEYRVWNQTLNQYLWTRIDATSEGQPDGTSLVYALYTDVTSQKNLELKLEKSRESMAAALTASNLLSYEYDPITHTGICFTDDNYFGLPKVIQNYPDSLKDIDLFYPEDADVFIATAHKMDADTKKAQCDVRIKKNGEYEWYSCIFDAFYDEDKQHQVAILTVIDISERMALIQGYEEQVQTLIRRNDSSMTVATMNLTDNTFVPVHIIDELKDMIDRSKTMEDVFRNYEPQIVYAEEREAYRKLFNREQMIALAEQGITHVQHEHQYYLSPKHIEWIQVGMDMVKNPINGEITGVCYSKNIQRSRMTNSLLSQILNVDYMMTVVVNLETEEYYLLDSAMGKPGEMGKDFWREIGNVLVPFANGLSAETITRSLSKQKVLDVLTDEPAFNWTFDGVYRESTVRLGVKANYLDERNEYLLVTLRNITDEVLVDRLRHESEHDPLTDLYNRKTVFRKCRELLDAHPEEQFVMTHVDMKHFRLYNTFFGDEAGDKLLCDVSDMFRWMAKDYEYWAYGRIEADVFCAFFPYDPEKYQNHLSRAMEQLRNYRTDFLIEPVLGLYFVTDREMPIEAMFTRAALAAGLVQPETPYATMIYDESQEQKLTEDQQIMNEMQPAIDQEQFHVYLQPKYSLQTNEAIGAEALVRWVHPEKGIISPAKFIPLFEGNGFITTLDRYMWEHVCQLLRKWTDEGKVLAPISVNVSRLSMFSKSTVSFLKNLVERYRIDPQYLELELTESAYIDDPDEMKQQIKALRAAGFKILMDDFGSGYSCLNTLRELPVDMLKLDRKFLSESQVDSRGMAVLSSVVQMSKSLKLPIVAEGVEKEEQAEYLRSIGCEFVQGFLYAKPMCVSEYEKIM